MLYSALLVATTAFAGFAAAQNSTGSLPDGFPQCCTPQTAPNMTTKQEWCNANTNTCVEICGTDADVATQGNVCSAQDLSYTCKCRNGTQPDMKTYQQSVPALQCREWFSQCVIAAGDGFQSAEWKRNCESVSQAQCGNTTITQDGSSSSDSSSSSSSSIPSRTSSGSPDATNSGGSSPASSSPAAAALNAARDFGMPIFAAGMIAVFGIAL